MKNLEPNPMRCKLKCLHNLVSTALIKKKDEKLVSHFITINLKQIKTVNGERDGDCEISVMSSYNTSRGTVLT